MMKGLLRHFLVNLGALWIITQILPAVSLTGGIQGLLIGAIAFMFANLLLVPVLKVLLLPLNLLTLGLFSWLSNVLALYFLVNVVPYFKIEVYHFSGLFWEGFSIPSVDFTVFQVVIIASFMLGLIINLINWIIK